MLSESLGYYCNNCKVTCILYNICIYILYLYVYKVGYSCLIRCNLVLSLTSLLSLLAELIICLDTFVLTLSKS